jgi:uncharacterized membrane protein
MTLLNDLHSAAFRNDDESTMQRDQHGGQQGRQDRSQQGWNQGRQRVNVGDAERGVSVTAGAILALTGLSRRSIPGLLIGGVGAAMIHRGVTGHCYAYQSMGVDTAQDEGLDEEAISERGIHVEQAFLINRSPEDLYNFWRNFENLPQIMTHLESVRVLDDRRSHWVAKAPRIAGGSVEWDAEITRDDRNSAIAWKSLPGSGVDNAGEIRFSPAPGDRGTEVHVYMDYVPPAGKLGHWIATLFGESPRRQMRDDLRNFKRLMETGDILTINGQPRGTCTHDGGTRERFNA